MVEVSAAKRNITPPFPMYMRGYAMRTGKSIGVLDELYCRTLVLRIDGEIFIWSTLDLCRLEEPISDYARTVLAGKYSVPKENIIIGTIHTHSGPDISFEDEGEDRNHRKDRWMAGKLEHTCYYMVFIAEQDHVDIFIAWFVNIIAVSVYTFYGSLYHIRCYF